MTKRAEEFELDPPDQIVHAFVGVDVDVKGRDVDQHSAGALQRCRGPRRDRQIYQNVVVAGVARQIARQCRNQHRRRSGTGTRIPLVQGSKAVRRHRGTDEFATRSRRSLTRCQRRTVLDAGHSPGPVFAVGLEPTRFAVLLIEFGQRRDVERLVYRRLPALDCCGVDRGNAIHYRHSAVSVESNVVNPGVPQVVSIASLENCHLDETITRQVERRRVIVVHPLRRSLPRVLTLAEVEVVDTRIDREVHDLARLTIGVHQPQKWRLELVGGLHCSAAEQLYVQVAVELDVLRNEIRHRRVKLLRKPHTALHR